MTVTLMLAAGDATRWAGTIPKQFVDVEGETLIARTQRQARERGYNPIVVSHRRDIGSVSHHPLVERTHANTLPSVTKNLGSGLSIT